MEVERERSALRRATPYSVPAGVERMSGGVDVDQERCVVRRGGLPLTGLAIDLGPYEAGCQWIRDEKVVDPHAEVLVEVARPVVPPRIACGLLVMTAIGIDEAPVTQRLERGPLGG